MKTIIAEKPSVAKEIARLLGASEKKDGYLTGNGYFVTWAFGHLIGLGMPEDYGITGFDKASLPILPNPFLLTVRKVKKDKGYTIDTRALKQLKVIEQLFNRSDSIIVATDAGREGELIFRYIYEYLKCNKPFERLWISSLTEKAIKQGFDTLKDGKEFDGLYQSAQGRSRADWLVGINATQALSIVADNGIYSLGRVQTPTLALICKRYLENKNFSVKKYWQIQLSHNKELIDFKSISKTKWEDQKIADDALKAIQRIGIAIITSLATKSVTEQSPLLFDLTGLQKEANKKLNLSAEETLNIAQSLYEKRLITYPRTDSRFLTEDMAASLPGLVTDTGKAFAVEEPVPIHVQQVINGGKVTDHHALLPTKSMANADLAALPAGERNVLRLIAARLLCAVGEPHRYAETTLTTICAGVGKSSSDHSVGVTASSSLLCSNNTLQAATHSLQMQPC